MDVAGADPEQRGTALERKLSRKAVSFQAEQVLAPVGEPKSRLQQAAIHARLVDLATLRRSLQPDEMVLEYVLDEPSSFCLRITRTSAAVTVLPEGRRRIEELAENYVVAVRSRESSAQAGGQLYASLLAPVLSKDDKPKVIIVPDGKLLLLPLDSVPDTKGQYLLESHSVFYAPSATVLYLIRTARPTHQPTLPFLGIGDVQYSVQPPASSTNDRRDSPSAAGPADPFDLAGARLQDIPKTRDEVLQAGQVFTHGSRLLLGQEATEARFIPLCGIRIIHIAAHGDFDLPRL